MTLRRFAWLLASRGPDLSAWPEPDRAAATVLLRVEPAARAALADALATEDAPPPDGAALRRMQNRVRRALAPPPPVVRGVRWATLAACVVAGLYLGLSPMAEADGASALTSSALASSALASSMDGAASATVLAALDP